MVKMSYSDKGVLILVGVAAIVWALIMWLTGHL